MAILKCKICGGDIILNEEKTFYTCEYCGSSMTLPRVSDEQKAALYNRGNHFRRIGEFDKALAIYENIVREDNTDAEAHWCCVLCRFGIEYVEDPATYEYLPTCHRASFDSILEDVDYLAAIEYSDGITRRQYQKDAIKISEVQKGILATSQNEEPFDIFICYKETDDTTKERTRDSVDAQEIYYQLTQEGYRVFFSRITLEDKAGTEYEPYIFAALNSAKVMIAIGSKPEYFNAVWVKNEWSRFISLMKKDRSKLLIPCYKEMDPYDLPEQLSILQSYDMTKIGFIQDLIRGINKVVKTNEAKSIVKETFGTGNANTSPLLERAFLFLEDGKWKDADIYCEKVLDMDPRNAEAYLGKLMAELHVNSRSQLADYPEPFGDRENYGKVIRFGNEKLETEIRGYNDHIRERNENTRLLKTYNNAVSIMNVANSESAYKKAVELFKTIPGFKDADLLAEQCAERADVCRKDAIYDFAKAKMTGTQIESYEEAIKNFSKIIGWKDAGEQMSICREKIDEIMEEAEADRLKRERQAETDRLERERKEEANRLENERQREQWRIEAEQKHIAIEKAAKIRKRVIAIVISITVASIIFVFVLKSFIIPYLEYNAAVKLYNAGRYQDAIVAFTALDEYKDSVLQIEKCKMAIEDQKYTAAIELYNSGKYQEAIAKFTALDGYKDSVTQIEKCKMAIKDEKYNIAVELNNAGKFQDAIVAFMELDGYKDSEAKINEIKPKALADASVGSTVFLGSYEQDNNTSNGKEDIEWIVLAKDNNKVLVISKYALDCQKYNKSYTSVTWETCSLCKWLNGYFQSMAFSVEERAVISIDQIFLLSHTEAVQYLTSDSIRQCQGTAYCYSQGAHKDSYNKTCWWWLRWPLDDASTSAAYIDSYGSINASGDGAFLEGPAVRPAMWINLEPELY